MQVAIIWVLVIALMWLAHRVSDLNATTRDLKRKLRSVYRELKNAKKS